MATLTRTTTLYLTGRAKNLIVTEGGKNVYPEEIENRFQLYSEVEQVLIKGYAIARKQNSEGIEAYIFPARSGLIRQAPSQARPMTPPR
ncbi:hypothetical protein MASR2M48_13430 [Spirochaetota bacterium]